INGDTLVKTLNLRARHLTTLPDAIGNLKKLKVCRLDSNELTSIPAAIGQCSLLVQLILSNNKLTTVPPTIGNLKKLTSLLLDNNLIDSLPVELMNCPNLSINAPDSVYAVTPPTFTIDSNKLCNISIIPPTLITWLNSWDGSDASGYLPDTFWLKAQKCTP
ncbi:MAG: hypothetical protein PHC61_13165, partial [Chitinivibrionales bacterium]|nr:hypothetical protein [Chitinivibrionales bacterium]